MLKKTFIVLLLVCLLTGCNGRWGSPKNRIPQGNQGNASQTDNVKERVIGSIEGEIELPDVPVLDENGGPLPNQKIRIDGVDAELPVGSKGKFRLSADGRSSLDSFTEMSSSWKLNSAPVQLFVFGGIMVAVGVVLMFFGMWWLGMGISAGGASLIACGIMINQYPWVVLIVIGVGLVAAGYYIYVEHRKKNLLGENKDTNFVLEELVEAISEMPHDMLDEYIKKPLREHDQSDLIRQITRRARFRR
jgi:hypothetical protein